MSPGTSYTGKPVRRLKLPKIGPRKTTSLFEEYFYVLLGVTFLGMAILGKAGGMSGFNAAVVGAWVASLIWFVRQWKGYRAENAKTAAGKNGAPPGQARVEALKGPLPLSPGMKPMIGPQWPVKPGVRPAWPRLAKQQPEPAAQRPLFQTPAARTSAIQAPPNQPAGTNSDEKKRAFIYERPTLPDRKPKLPNNWATPDNKKPGNKKPKR